MKTGKVYLLGAGPGDPDLITRKGLKLIRNADVILYDRLIPRALLDEASDEAELIDVGKAPHKQRRGQDEINDLIVEHALAGNMVVRLKGGDPLVFGRGSEEALVCHEFGIPFEIVPGISSAFAVPAYAGIPLTHRDMSSSFSVITGHDDNALNYEALVRLGGTIIVMMGVASLPRIMDRLIDAGLDPQTPAAAIEWGTTETQRVIEGTVETLVAQTLEAQPKSPAITIIGKVVGLRGMGMQWFETLENSSIESSYGE